MLSSTKHGDTIAVHIITINNHNRDNKTTKLYINAGKKIINNNKTPIRKQGTSVVTIRHIKVYQKKKSAKKSVT